MTAQIGDSYFYEGKDYQIVALSEPLEFDPQLYGFTPQCIETACWNGFWCQYKISEDGIFLDKLFINSMNDNYPDLNGVTFEKNETDPVSYMGYRIYNDLNMKMEYHGRILVGSGLIHDYYIHMGYQRAFAYKVLKEFIFEEGVLLDIIDHSDMAEKLRAEEDKKRKVKTNTKKKKRSSTLKNIEDFVEESFSLEYKDKCWWIK